MAPKLLWITIVHVLSWNLIFSLSESVEFNNDGETSSDIISLRDRVRYTTRIRECLKNSVVDQKNYERLSGSGGRVDGFENPESAKDSSKPSRHVKRHAILRCHNKNVLAQENNNEPDKPNKPAEPTTSEWQMKSTPVNDAHGDYLYDQMTIQKSKFADLKKIDFNSHKAVHREPAAAAAGAHHRYSVPLVQRGDPMDKNPTYEQLELTLQDTRDKIKSLMSMPQHKLGELIPDKLFDGSVHNKQPTLTLPIPPKFVKYPAGVDPYARPAKTPVGAAAAPSTTDDYYNGQTSDPSSKPSPYFVQDNGDKDFYQKDSLAENKQPFLSVPPIQFNKPKPAEISYDKRVPPVAYLPRPAHQFMQIPAIRPLQVPPIFVQKQVSPAANERPNIGSQYPKIIKNGIAQPTFQPATPSEKEVSHNKPQTLINFSPAQDKKTSNAETVNKPMAIIEKKVSLFFPHKKPQEVIGLTPLTTARSIETSDTEAPPPYKPFVVDRGVLMSAPQPFGDLLLQPPKWGNVPASEIFIKATTAAAQTTAAPAASVPYEQKQPIISVPSVPQITETFDSESTPQPLPIENEVSVSTPYVQQQQQQQPTVNYLPPPPQLQQIKIQKEITIPLPYYPKPKVGAPPKLIKTFNSELIPQSISQQKQNSLSGQQQPIVLPSLPPLTKTTTSDYVN